MKMIHKRIQEGKTTEIIKIIKQDSKAVMIVPVEMMKLRLHKLYPNLKKQIRTMREFESRDALKGYGFTSAHIDDIDMILATKSNFLSVKTISLTKRD